MREAVIVSAVRTAVGKAKKGSLAAVHPIDLGAIVVKEALHRAGEGLTPSLVDDVIMGCAFPEGEQGMNIARMIALRAGLPVSTPGITINRYCSSGLQSIAYAAEQVMLGSADVMIAGGVESMSRVPMGGHKLTAHPWLVENWPEAYMSMGHTAEEVARRYAISRAEQDAFSLRSHQRAAQAIAAGRFKEEIVPIPVPFKSPSPGAVQERGQEEKESFFDTDEGVRPDTSAEQLARLKPAFHVRGSVTAGNASPTSDGAAAVLVMSREKAKELGIKPLLIYRAYAVGGVEPEIMGMGPVVAVPKALQRAEIGLEQVDLIELNEAFASQAIQVIRELKMDEDRVNVNGGAIALGHPLGCTGAKLTVQLLHEMKRERHTYGLVTMCIGGGMGAAGVFELAKEESHG